MDSFVDKAKSMLLHIARLLSEAYSLEMNGKNMRNITPINKQAQTPATPMKRTRYTAEA